jgi:hypothetical protein
MNVAFGFSFPYWYEKNGKLLINFYFLDGDRL